MFEKLKPGDIIGVVNPSSPVKKEDIEDINKSVLLMEGAGFKIKFGKNVFKNTLGYSATPKEKADDINEMFLDKEVKMIFCMGGGFNSNSTFEYLNYNVIKNNPKPICGFSDSTSLTNIIYNQTGIITFNGPTFKSLTSWDTEYGYKQVIQRFGKGSLKFGEPDDEYITIKEGICEGRLVGGNLSLTSQMSAGNYSIDFQDKILFIEELYIETPPELAFNYLYHMKQNKVFDKVNGIWVGNYEGNVALEKILLDVLQNEYDFPIIKSNNFGHIDKKTVIPVGGKAKIDTNKNIKIELIEELII